MPTCLAADLDEETAIQYIDRFLMYYIQTADRLTRTSVWLENMEGGIEQLRDVIVHDKLGICDELERQMQHLVDTYQCEWTEVVNDPERRKRFRQFVNTDDTEVGIEIVTERGQNRPADWPKDGALYQIKPLTRSEPAATKTRTRSAEVKSQWVKVGSVADFPARGRRGDQVRAGADRRLPLRQPRRVVRLPEHVPAQAGLRSFARHPRQPRRDSQGRLPAAQENIFAGDGRVPVGRRVFGEGVSGESRGTRRVPSLATDPATRRALGH